jgi:hypothetical protein
MTNKFTFKGVSRSETQKTKTSAFLFGMLAAVLAFGLVLAGCPADSDDDDDDGGKDNGPPAITEPTTGRATVSYSNVPISGADTTLTVNAPDGARGITAFSITGGKLTLELGTPDTPQPVDYLLSHDGYGDLFGGNSGDYEVTVSPSDTGVNVVAIDSFHVQVSNIDYYLDRSWEDTDGATYQNSSEIIYVYVSGNVTLSRDVKTSTSTFEGGTYTMRYSAFSLPLKTGWNLVQYDKNFTVSANNATVQLTLKIADKDIPWVLDVDEDDEDDEESEGSAGSPQ